ncbi:hypothetical protein O6H91_21G024200 [Diphasiastrum complanatum]|uniref:Uncharacterized protein n=1 Tax=Diphasiastrum complanatum TaxID=34168 RepID=A0ACC2AIR4_DIPCM|nr:hypothetical protein O6H91_21G024200 [Diphasiastrum complanatum]
MLGDEDDNGVEVSLELCLGRPAIKPACVSQPRRSEDERSLVTDRVVDGGVATTGFRHGREMSTMAVDSAAGFVSDKYATEFYQTSCSLGCVREMDEKMVFPQRVLANMSVTSVELPGAGYVAQDSSASALRKTFSDAAGCLSNAYVDAQWKDVISQQHVLDHQRKRELHAQKRQAARKKRKLLIGEQKNKKLEIEKSKLFPNSPTHSISSPYTKESLPYLPRSAEFQDIRHALQRERDGAHVKEKELMFGFKPKANDEPNLPTGRVSDHNSAQPTEEHDKLETDQWIQKVHELRKVMSPNAPSITQNRTPTSEMAYSPSHAFQTDFTNSDQANILLKKAKFSLDKTEKAMPARDKVLQNEVPKLLNDQISSRNESTASPTTGFETEAPATPFWRSLPTFNADYFIPTPFTFPLQNVGGLSHPVPNFMLASQALRSYGESPCTSFQFSIPPGSTPFQRATLDTTASIESPVLQKTASRHRPISRTKRRKGPGRSRQLEQICFQGIQEEVAASGPSHSGKSSSSSSEVYQSAHGETVESYPTRVAADMNVEALQEHGKQRATAATTHKQLPSSDGLSVSTTANGKTIKGVLQTYNEGEVKIRCYCHGNYMNAREFVVHAGGIADPHPERRILVLNPFLYTDPRSPSVQY